MKKYSHYIMFLTPVAPGAVFWQSDEHPLSREGYSAFTQQTARRVSHAVGQTVPPQSIYIQTLIPLPEDVARSHFENQPQGNPGTLRLYELDTGDLVRGDAATGKMVDPPHAPVPESARVVLGGEAVLGITLLDSRCSECNKKQFHTPSGVTCPNGHNGRNAAPAEEEPA